MAVVAGVLLDHVDQKLPQRHRLTRSITTDEVQVSVTDELFGKGDLVLPCGPGFVHDCLIPNRTIEVAIRLSFGLIPIWYALAREPLPEPLALYLGQVSYQTEERHGRRLNGAAGELGGIQTLALELKGEALEPQVFGQRGTLVAERHTSLPRISLRIDEPIGAVLRLCHGAMLAAEPWRQQPGERIPR